MEDKAMTVYLRDIQKIPTIPEKDKGDLARRARDGDVDAMHDLVKAHLRFVVYIAKKYMNRGLPISDLVNEGNIGLIKAVKKFDETRGFKFTTYAVWWIRQRMQQAVVENSHTIRLPMNKELLLQKMSRFMNDYWKSFQQEPSVAEIAEAMNMKEYDVYSLMGMGGRLLSLDGPEDFDGENSLRDYVADDSAAPPDAVVMEDRMRSDVGEIISTLSDREETVVRLYFGIGGRRSFNLEEIGGKLNLSRERIRQIKKKALEKLAHGTRGESLRLYAS